MKKPSIQRPRSIKAFRRKINQQEHTETKASQLTIIIRTLEGDPVNLGRTHALLGAISNSIGQPTKALTHLNTALTIYEQYNRQREIANVSCNIGDAHLRKAEHSLAQAAFRRSLHLAERVGDVPLISVVFGNLGVLAARAGNLMEAETWFKRGITVAEQINEQIYMNIFYVYLAGVLQDKGDLAESRTNICRALKIGRAMRNNPCIGFALVSLGNMYTLQAKEALNIRTFVKRNQEIDAKTKDRQKDYLYYLTRAKKILEYAVALEELEAESKIEGQLALSQIALLSGDLEAAYRNHRFCTGRSYRIRTKLDTCTHPKSSR